MINEDKLKIRRSTNTRAVALINKLLHQHAQKSFLTTRAVSALEECRNSFYPGRT